jgi:hypothetical protein
MRKAEGVPRGRLAAVLAATLAAVTWTAAADAQGSPACRQARQTVDEVVRLYASPTADRTVLLHRLATARDLCPSFGEAWKVSACLARELGQDTKARIYTDRAVLNGVTDLSCGGGAARPARVAELGPVRDKHALVVGIGSFADDAIPELRHTAKDARDFYAYLVDSQGGRFDRGNVHLLVDAEATRAGILTALQKIFLAAQEEDLLVVYLSSHGSPAEGGLGLQGVGYIVTYDTDLDSLFVDALAFQDFSEKVSMIKARRKVTFLDTCYSGQALRPGEKTLSISALGIGDETAKLFTAAEGSYLITSSDANEQSWESDRLENSYFTYYLLEALRRSGDPPPLEEVFAELTAKVAAAVRNEKLARQNPQLHPRDLPADLRIGAASTTWVGTTRPAGR